MKTWEDLQALGDGDKRDFIISAVSDHKGSPVYTEAKTAYEYYCRRNVTIAAYQKLLYTLSGEAVPDNWSANFKFMNGFYPLFIRQEVSHLLGSGVTFNDEKTKEKLGGDGFDERMVELAKAALWGAVSFGFYNLDKIDVFTITEFVPLVGEEDGALHAGIRFWQIDATKPLRATLYEPDGYTEYIWRGDEGQVLKEKRPYIQIVRTSEADGTELLAGKNYPGFPIVPLWGSDEHQSSLVGLREKIDGYDLIQSGFANDLDDASQIYWVIQNAGGMDDVDLVKFVERLKTVRAAVVDEGGSTAEAHTMEVPYAARTQALALLRESLYRDAMALDTDKVAAGNITATAIEACYENLSLKCDDFETQVTTFIRGILAVAGIDDSPTFKRSRIINMAEDTQMVLQAAQYLDDETILKHLPFLNTDEIADILDRKTKEEAGRFDEDDEEPEEPEEEEQEAKEE